MRANCEAGDPQRIRGDQANEIGKDGYQAPGMSVGKTALGGRELVVMARKPK